MEEKRAPGQGSGGRPVPQDRGSGEKVREMEEEVMNTTILIKVLLVITLVGIIGAIVGGDR